MSQAEAQPRTLPSWVFSTKCLHAKTCKRPVQKANVPAQWLWPILPVFRHFPKCKTWLKRHHRTRQATRVSQIRVSCHLSPIKRQTRICLKTSGTPAFRKFRDGKKGKLPTLTYWKCCWIRQANKNMRSPTSQMWTNFFTCSTNPQKVYLKIKPILLRMKLNKKRKPRSKAMCRAKIKLTFWRSTKRCLTWSISSNRNNNKIHLLS